MKTLKNKSIIAGLDIKQVREDFPILKEKVNGKQLVYFDNAATSQNPSSVIDRLAEYYRKENSNIHRGVHTLSNIATGEYEKARKRISRYINAADEKEIIFTRGTTEGINLVAHSYLNDRLNEKDEIIVTAMEHHSNIVPWQILCEKKKAILRVIPMNKKGELLSDELESMINERTKFISVSHMSNALGTINPVKELVATAHKHGIRILVDGAQSIPHKKIDVRDIGCDFFAFSGHKAYGPTGIGVLYGKEEVLEEMSPYQSGGDMIRTVTFEKTLYNDIPYKFEAGTPNISGVIGLGEAIKYIDSLGIGNIEKYEEELYSYAVSEIKKFEGIRFIGEAELRAGVISFEIEGIHPHDIGTILDQEGVAIRTGHHCAQPVMKFFNVPATARASFACYNTKEEVDIFINSIKKLYEVFK
ncbi:MAG: cysteine desulfurase [Acidobacteriota bacterium]